MITFHKSVDFHCSKLIRDPHGRYLLLQGRLQGSEVTFLTYYAPNSSQLPFRCHILQLLCTHSNGSVFLCGDSNLATNSVLHRSAPPLSTLFPDLKRFLSTFSQRVLWMWGRNYPLFNAIMQFFSALHKTHSQIDHIWIWVLTLRLVSNTRIQAVPWSDYNAVVLHCLGPSMIHFCLIKEYLTHFNTLRNILRYIQGQSIPLPNAIGNLKALLLGHLIQIVSSKQQARLYHITRFQPEFETLSTAYKIHPSSETDTKLQQVTTEFIYHLTDASECTLRCSKLRFYSKSNKPSMMLAKRCY